MERKYRIPVIILVAHIAGLALLSLLFGGTEHFISSYAMLCIGAIVIDIIILLSLAFSKPRLMVIEGYGLTIAALLVIFFFTVTNGAFSR